MSITPLALARSMKRQCERRATVEAVSPNTSQNSDGSVASFYVYDNDGGVLLVTVNQYKQPVR